eukprot:675987-Rhodomonas_salina.2
MGPRWTGERSSQPLAHAPLPLILPYRRGWRRRMGRGSNPPKGPSVFDENTSNKFASLSPG